jgi:hypothetical protein
MGVYSGSGCIGGYGKGTKLLLGFLLSFHMFLNNFPFSFLFVLGGFFEKRYCFSVPIP